MLSACLLPNCCVYLTPLCLTGDLHRDSRHAALWCFLHGLSLHNGEQQRQRYCPIHFSSQSVFANLAASSFSLYVSCSSRLCPVLSSYLFCTLSDFPFRSPYSLLSVKQAPWRFEERACLVWVTTTWSLTLPVLALNSNLPGGQLSQCV